MSQFPSMPMFTGDMLGDTEHLSNEEFGAYHRLLYAMWRRNGSVPDDDRDLARICHCSYQKWPHMKRRLLQFLTVLENGDLTQKKLKKVRAAAEQLVQKQRQNAHRRWHPDSNENNDLAYATGYAKSMPPARATPKPNNKSSTTVHYMRSDNGRAAMASSPGFGGRSSATPSNNPYPETELPAFGSFAATATDPTTITPEEAELIRSRLKH